MARSIGWGPTAPSEWLMVDASEVSLIVGNAKLRVFISTGSDISELKATREFNLIYQLL